MDSSTRLEQVAKEIEESFFAAGAAIAIGGEIGGIMKNASAFAELAFSEQTRQLAENFLPPEDFEGEYIPLTLRFDLDFDIPEPDKNAGFVHVGNDTWQPKALYGARERQRSLMARKPESGIVWTR